MEDPEGGSMFSESVHIAYMAVQTPDTMGNFTVVCEAYNTSLPTDVDHQARIREAVHRIRVDICPSFHPDVLHRHDIGELEGRALDFVRDGQWRVLVVIQLCHNGTLSDGSDTETRAKDLLLLMWRMHAHYRSPESSVALGAFLLQHDGVPGGQRVAEDVRAGPRVLKTRRVVRFNGEDCGLLDEVADEPLSAWKKQMAILRFVWCMVLFGCVWTCCLGLATCLCLLAMVAYAWFV